jgi:HEPN domain-containing protein
MKKLTAPWIRKAESDWRAANNLAKAKPPFHDEACFHCQQAAEKFFKALLQEWNLTIPKIHDLDILRNLLLSHDPTFASLTRKLDWLTQYAVDWADALDRRTGRWAVGSRQWAEDRGQRIRPN